MEELHDAAEQAQVDLAGADHCVVAVLARNGRCRTVGGHQHVETDVERIVAGGVGIEPGRFHPVDEQVDDRLGVGVAGVGVGGRADPDLGPAADLGVDQRAEMAGDLRHDAGDRHGHVRTSAGSGGSRAGCAVRRREDGRGDPASPAVQLPVP